MRQKLVHPSFPERRVNFAISDQKTIKRQRTSNGKISENLMDWNKELTDEERDALIESLANRVVKYKMQVPAILALEMHRPFSFLAGQSMLLGSGFLAPIFGAENLQRCAKLLEKRENTDRLLLKIEQTKDS